MTVSFSCKDFFKIFKGTIIINFIFTNCLVKNIGKSLRNSYSEHGRLFNKNKQLKALLKKNILNSFKRTQIYQLELFTIFLRVIFENDQYNMYIYYDQHSIMVNY